MMVNMEVVGVRIEMPSNQPIVLLKEVEGSRFLPMASSMPSFKYELKVAPF